MSSILKMLSLFSGSRGRHGPDLPSPCGENSTFHFTPCLMMGEVSFETSPKNIMIQNLINSKTVLHYLDMDWGKFPAQWWKSFLNLLLNWLWNQSRVFCRSKTLRNNLESSLLWELLEILTLMIGFQQRSVELRYVISYARTQSLVFVLFYSTSSDNLPLVAHIHGESNRSVIWTVGMTWQCSFTWPETGMASWSSGQCICCCGGLSGSKPSGDNRHFKQDDAFSRVWRSVISIDKLITWQHLPIKRNGGHVVLKASSCLRSLIFLSGR